MRVPRCRHWLGFTYAARRKRRWCRLCAQQQVWVWHQSRYVDVEQLSAVARATARHVSVREHAAEIERRKTEEGEA